MPTRASAPSGSPCWTDLWTSDVEASRSFYSGLFGWEAQEPSPDFGGYFMFTRDGVPIAGGMGDMGELHADNTWKIYFATDDLARTVEAATAAGAQIVFPPMEVADLGTQAVLIDPTGAPLGLWQPGTFLGFTVLNETGAPRWFELSTRDYAAAVAFYRDVFGWSSETVRENEGFRYATLSDPSGSGPVAGIMGGTDLLPEGVGAHWLVHWEVDDADAAVDRVKTLGGSVVEEPQDSAYGRAATATDPTGAPFKLWAPNR